MFFQILCALFLIVSFCDSVIGKCVEGGPGYNVVVNDNKIFNKAASTNCLLSGNYIQIRNEFPEEIRFDIINNDPEESVFATGTISSKKGKNVYSMRLPKSMNDIKYIVVKGPQLGIVRATLPADRSKKNIFWVVNADGSIARDPETLSYFNDRTYLLSPEKVVTIAHNQYQAR